MKILWTSAIASTVFFTGNINANAAVFTLYNANGTNPNSQGSLKPGAICASNSPLGPSCNVGGAFPYQVSIDETQVLGAGVTLNTATNSAEYSGYSNYNPLSSTYYNTTTFNSSTLDQTTGYTINFTVNLDTVTDNTTTSNPRAAFSIIAISGDKKGIEIGFRTDEIFAQSNNFTSQAQTALFTTTSPTTYKLTVFADNYSLSSNGTPIINGALQNYVFNPASSDPPLPFNPYTTSSFLFFGDDTGQESGTFTLGSVNLDTTPVPFEFSPTYGLLAIATGMAINNWRKKTKNK